MTQETFESEFHNMAYANTTIDHSDGYYYSGNSFGHQYISDGYVGTDDSNFWSSSPRSDSSSPNSFIHQGSFVGGPYQSYKHISYSSAEHHLISCRNGYSQIAMTEIGNNNGVPFVRVIKRRSTANKKERRRTQSINNAYADLRVCIPNVPADTKLSKIKTLRLTISYINYLTRALESSDPAGGFKAELANLSRKNTTDSVNIRDDSQQTSASNDDEDANSPKRTKGRTGWPQHVWALELKQEQSI